MMARAGATSAMRAIAAGRRLLRIEDLLVWFHLRQLQYRSFSAIRQYVGIGRVVSSEGIKLLAGRE